MITFALSSLEKIINFYLHLDSENLTRLNDLAGKTIKLSITDWPIDLYISPDANGFHLHKELETPPDTVITGTLMNLFKTGLAKGKGTALFDNAIDISGDALVGEKIRSILADMDIDWEEHLSKVVGDIAAHQISTRFKKIYNFSKNTFGRLQENIKEFLQIESQQLPSRIEVEKFLDDVSSLQYAVDRAEARLNYLQVKRKPAQ